jgi:hypothetical protein
MKRPGRRQGRTRIPAGPPAKAPRATAGCVARATYQAIALQTGSMLKPLHFSRPGRRNGGKTETAEPGRPGPHSHYSEEEGEARG